MPRASSRIPRLHAGQSLFDMCTRPVEPLTTFITVKPLAKARPGLTLDDPTLPHNGIMTVPDGSPFGRRHRSSHLESSNASKFKLSGDTAGNDLNSRISFSEHVTFLVFSRILCACVETRMRIHLTDSYQGVCLWKFRDRVLYNRC